MREKATSVSDGSSRAEQSLCHNRRRDPRRGPARNESRPTPMLLCGNGPFN
jgi:hypothetical protein